MTKVKKLKILFFLLNLKTLKNTIITSSNNTRIIDITEHETPNTFKVVRKKEKECNKRRKDNLNMETLNKTCEFKKSSILYENIICMLKKSHINFYEIFTMILVYGTLLIGFIKGKIFLLLQVFIGALFLMLILVISYVFIILLYNGIKMLL